MNLKMICVDNQYIGPDDCGDLHAVLRFYLRVCFTTKDFKFNQLNYSGQ